MIYEMYYDEINAELQEISARMQEEFAVATSDFELIFIGSGEDAPAAWHSASFS